MATRIGIRQLRDTLTATVRRARAGETFEVTHDGEPVALLGPIPDDRVERLIRSGIARGPARPFRVPTRQFRVTGPMTASEALQEDRGD